MNYRTRAFIINEVTNPVFYEGKLVNGPGTETATRMHTQRARDALRAFLEIKIARNLGNKDEQEYIDERTHLRLIYLPNAKDQLNQSKSKVNATSIEWMMHLCKKFFLGQGFGDPSGPLLDARDWKYVTPYAAQHQLYQMEATKLLNKIRPLGSATMEDIPEALIADAAQGLEFRHMIYDVTGVDRTGMISDDNKFTTHFTRGRYTVWIIAHLDIPRPSEERETGVTIDKRAAMEKKRSKVVKVITLLQQKHYQTLYTIDRVLLNQSEVISLSCTLLIIANIVQLLLPSFDAPATHPETAAPEETPKPESEAGAVEEEGDDSEDFESEDEEDLDSKDKAGEYDTLKSMSAVLAAAKGTAE